MTLKKRSTIKINNAHVSVLAKVRTGSRTKTPNGDYLIEDFVISMITNGLYGETCLCTYHNTDGVATSCVCLNQQQLHVFLIEMNIFNTPIHKALMSKLILISIREKEFRNEMGIDEQDDRLELLDALIGDIYAK